MKIKIAFIGLGRMGITHLSILNSNPYVEVIAACDPSKMLLSFFRKYFNKINLYDTAEELLANEQPDGIIVSTPPHLHMEIITQALKKGIHVFAEKPFTTSYVDALHLSEIAADKKLINQVGYVNRYNRMFIKTKEIIEKEIIGKVLRFKSEMFSYTVTKEDKGDGWRGNPDTGGGCLNEMASHAIDLVNYLVGPPADVTGSVLSRVHSKNVDDIVSSTLIYNNSISGTLYVNWCDPSYRKPSNKLEIFGREGKVLVDQHDVKVFMKNSNAEYKLSQGWNSLYITDVFDNVPFYLRGNEFTNQLYNFAECIKNKKNTNLCSFSDAALTQKVLCMIRDDSKKIKFNNYGTIGDKVKLSDKIKHETTADEYGKN